MVLAIVAVVRPVPTVAVVLDVGQGIAVSVPSATASVTTSVVDGVGVRCHPRHRCGEVLDIGAEGVVDRRVDGVRAFGDGLGHHIAGVVDGVGVITETADHGIGTRSTIDDIVAVAACDRVGELVARERQASPDCRSEILDLLTGGQCVVHRRVDGVGTFGGGFRDDIAGIVDGVGVVSQAADHRIGTRGAVDDIVAVAARDGVGQGVAGHGETGADRCGEVLDIGAEGVVDRRVDGVRAFGDGLGHHIAGVVDGVGVITETADHGVGTRGAVDDIVAVAARDGVGQGIAGQGETGADRCGEVLDIGAEGVVDRRVDGVRAFGDGLGHHIAGVVDGVGVITETADHGIGTRSTIDDIVAVAACDRVGELVARERQASPDCRSEILDLLTGGQCVVHRRVDGVGTFGGGFRDDIAGIVDGVGVVSQAADHRIGTRGTIDDIVAVATRDGVGQGVAGHGETGADRRGEVLDVGAEGVVDRRVDGVRAFGDGLGHHIAGVVDGVGVITETADHGVGTRGAVDDIVAVAARDGVGQGIAGQGETGADRR